MDQRDTGHKSIAIRRGRSRALGWSYIALLLIVPFAGTLVYARGPGAAGPVPAAWALFAPRYTADQGPGQDRPLPPAAPLAPTALATDEAPTDAEEPSDDGFVLLSMPLAPGPQPEGATVADANARDPLCIFTPPVPPPRPARSGVPATL